MKKLMQLLQKVLKLDRSDKAVEQIKRETQAKCRSAVSTIDKANAQLQKTQTYYMGKAMGVIINGINK